MQKKTSLRTSNITPNENISFPIGIILTVKKYYKKLSFSETFYGHKKRGRNINSLMEALLSYKLTERTRASQRLPLDKL